MSSAEWITNRPPTEADGDPVGHVRMKCRPWDNEQCLAHWSYVGAAAPWQHTSAWMPPTEPTPTEPDRIAVLVAALEVRVMKLEARLERVPEAIATAFDLRMPRQ